MTAVAARAELLELIPSAEELELVMHAPLHQDQAPNGTGSLLADTPSVLLCVCSDNCECYFVESYVCRPDGSEARFSQLNHCPSVMKPDHSLLVNHHQTTDFYGDELRCDTCDETYEYNSQTNSWTSTVLFCEQHSTMKPLLSQ